MENIFIIDLYTIINYIQIIYYFLFNKYLLSLWLEIKLKRLRLRKNDNNTFCFFLLKYIFN